MFCSRCIEFKIILVIEKYIVCKSPKKGKFLKELFDELTENTEIERKCENYKKKISINELYFYDNKKVIEVLYSFIAEELSSRIKECKFCSEKEVIYASMRHGEYFEEDDDIEGIVNDYDTSIEVSEFIEEEFMIESIDKIIQSMYYPCKKCATSSRHSEETPEFFSNISRIYTQEAMDEFNERFYIEIENIEKKIDLLAGELTMEELVDLKN